MKKILAVDDEAPLLRLIAGSLSDEYEVLTTTDPTTVIETLKTNTVDLILLDISMPLMNGFEVCAAVRAIKDFEDIPMVFLTGRNESYTRAISYKVGGDNFVTKPFDLAELKAIIERYTKKIVHKSVTALSYGDITIDPLSHQILINNHEIELAPKEFQILLYFVQHPEVVVTRELLLTKIWRDSLKVTDRTIDTHISNLRKKISEGHCQIKSVYHEGYIFMK